MGLGLHPFAHHGHAESLQVFHQTRQHVEGVATSRSLKQQGTIQLHDLVGEHHQTLEVARLGAEVVAGDVGAMGPQHLDHLPVLALDPDVFQHLEPDVYPSLRAWSSTSNSRLR